MRSVLSNAMPSRDGCRVCLWAQDCVGCNIDVVDDNNDNNDHNRKAHIHHRYLWLQSVIFSETTAKSCEALSLMLSRAECSPSTGPLGNMLSEQLLHNFDLFTSCIEPESFHVAELNAQRCVLSFICMMSN